MAFPESRTRVVPLSTVDINIRLAVGAELASGPALESVDHTLIDRAKSDPQAFGRLFEIYYLRVLGYTYRCTWNRTVAEDLTSATFFKALRSIHRYDHRSRFSAWLYRIATNEIRMHWRARARAMAAHRRVVQSLEAVCVQPDPTALEVEESTQEQNVICAQVRDAVGQLPDRYRTVIMLRYFEGLPCDMVAEVLHRRIGTVKSLLHRGTRRLRTILEQGGMS